MRLPIGLDAQHQLRRAKRAVSIGRSVYFMLKRNKAFEMATFLAN